MLKKILSKANFLIFEVKIPFLYTIRTMGYAVRKIATAVMPPNGVVFFRCFYSVPNKQFRYFLKRTAR